MLSLIVARAISFYGFLIIGYVLLSWLPATGAVFEIRKTIGMFVEPYLGLFRRIVPNMGMIDISPIIGLLVLQLLVAPLLLTLLSSIGL
ncbi:MAG: YggT family protein [Coriobacteriia bacterium]|nr:YggT family protein [Coriobacteriia bacterium]